MEDEIKFIDKEIQRLEEILSRTTYRLRSFKNIKKSMEEKSCYSEKIVKIQKLIQMDMFGT